MTRARRLQSEQRELAIERAGVMARRCWYLARLRDLHRDAPANRRRMWFYLFEQALLMQEGA